MNELTTVRKKIADLFDRGDIAALDRLHEVLNKTMAELAIMRALLSPTQEPEQPLELDIELEMDESPDAAQKVDFTEPE